MNPDLTAKRRLLQRVDSDSPHLKVGEVTFQFSLPNIKNSVFRRFEWVIPSRLARSSAPYYDREDADESINETSIEFLNSHKEHHQFELCRAIAMSEGQASCGWDLIYTHQGYGVHRSDPGTI